MQIELLPHRRIPTVGAAEENFGAEIAGFGGGERLRPLHAGGRVGAGTVGTVLGKPRTLFGGFFVPVIPTLGADVVAHPAFQIHHARIVAPRAPSANRWRASIIIARSIRRCGTPGASPRCDSPK